MSSTNTYTETMSADYLNDVRKHIAANKAKNTSQINITSRYILPTEDILLLGDSVTVASDAEAGTFQTAQDSINLTELTANGQYDKTAYSMPGMGYITQMGDTRYYGRRSHYSGFVGGTRVGFYPVQPITMGFWEFGT